MNPDHAIHAAYYLLVVLVIWLAMLAAIRSHLRQRATRRLDMRHAAERLEAVCPSRDRRPNVR